MVATRLGDFSGRLTQCDESVTTLGIFYLEHDHDTYVYINIMTKDLLFVVFCDILPPTASLNAFFLTLSHYLSS